jgi:hypothetical protein
MVPGTMGTVPVEVVRALAVTSGKLSLRLDGPQQSFQAGGAMPKSLSNARVRQEVLDRLGRLSPEATPLWGRMTAPQMLAHLADWMLMAQGELEVAAIQRLLRYPPIKQLVIYYLPFPKGVPTAPELIKRKPSAWAVEHAAVCRHVQSFENSNQKELWPAHPVFGKMTPRAWGVLAYRHMDHHLRQFGN